VGSTIGLPASIIAAQELVVPRSIPNIFMRIHAGGLASA
jgi:hypothetical protein